MANRDPMSGVATSAINARGIPTNGLTRDTNPKTTNAHKPRPESSAVFVTWSHLAPSALAGSERLAPANIRAAPTPSQKYMGSKDEPIQPNWIEAKKRPMIANTAPQQPTSEARPAPAASATRSQTLRIAPPQITPERPPGTTPPRPPSSRASR